MKKKKKKKEEENEDEDTTTIELEEAFQDDAQAQALQKKQKSWQCTHPCSRV